jgi:hypothetical protein
VEGTTAALTHSSMSGTAAALSTVARAAPIRRVCAAFVAILAALIILPATARAQAPQLGVTTSGTSSTQAGVQTPSGAGAAVQVQAQSGAQATGIAPATSASPTQGASSTSGQAGATASVSGNVSSNNSSLGAAGQTPAPVQVQAPSPAGQITVQQQASASATIGAQTNSAGKIDQDTKSAASATASAGASVNTSSSKIPKADTKADTQANAQVGVQPKESGIGTPQNAKVSGQVNGAISASGDGRSAGAVGVKLQADGQASIQGQAPERRTTGRPTTEHSVSASATISAGISTPPHQNPNSGGIVAASANVSVGTGPSTIATATEFSHESDARLAPPNAQLPPPDSVNPTISKYFASPRASERRLPDRSALAAPTNGSGGSAIAGSRGGGDQAVGAHGSPSPGGFLTPLGDAGRGVAPVMPVLVADVLVPPLNLPQSGAEAPAFMPWTVSRSDILSLIELAARSPGLAPVAGSPVRDVPAASAAPASPFGPISSPSQSGSSAAAGPPSSAIFGMFAVLTALMMLATPQLGRRRRLSPAVWRPVAFVAPLERPG